MSGGRWFSAVVLAAMVGWASVPGRAQPSRVAQWPADGASLYRAACASCHGITGQGNGPMAPMLKRVPPDLTLMASQNGGLFPTARIRRIVDGREVTSHGDPDMPVWGLAFKSTHDGYSEESVRARIDAIVGYLESIQKRNAQ